MRCSPPSSSSAAAVVAVVLLCAVWSSAEKQLVCSSDSMSVWYEYDAPLYFFSVNVPGCSNGMTLIDFSYSVITMFSIRRMGWSINIYYRQQHWIEFSSPIMPCSNFKICHIIKGETIHDSFSLPFKRYHAAQGEYQVFVRLQVIDEFEREIVLRVNATLHVRH